MEYSLKAQKCVLENDLDIEMGALRYACLDQSWHCSNAKAGFNRLYFVTSGKGDIVVNGVPYELLPGNIYFIPFRSEYVYNCDDRLEKLFLHINVPSIDRSDCFETLRECVVFEDRPDTVRLMLELANSDGMRAFLGIRHVIYSLLYEIISRYDLGQPKYYSPAVLKALRYIENHYLQKPSEAEIAAEAFVSSSHLRKLFKNQMGISVNTYINKRILQAAEHDLRNPDLPIREISEKYGYCDQFYFSRVFRAEYGEAPAQYRKRLRS